MHPRNPYRTPPDFLTLAEGYPALKPHLIRNAAGVTIDFHDISAQRCLTQALLHRDFGLDLTVPDDRLCPPVPNRLNYILWIEDIMNYISTDNRQGTTLMGLDIGTGASAIYPLLGCKLKQLWQYIATDIDAHSLEYAQANIKLNGLEQRIKTLQVLPQGPILPPDVFDIRPQIDFAMCNPPFYSDREEVLRSAEAKELGPNAVCTGADTEMITPGGEIAFVGRIVKESIVLKTQCRWYSSMLGKLSSLQVVVALLREEKVDNYAITEFVQGKTRRWAIAWSFTDERLPDVVARIQNPALQSLMPLRTTLKQSFPSVWSIDKLYHTLRTVIRGMRGVTIQAESTSQDRSKIHSFELCVHATENTWSRAARRKRLTGGSAQPLTDTAPALFCSISAGDGTVQHNQAGTKGGQISLGFQWVRGLDRGLFETFMSHVARKAEGALKISDVEMAL